MKNVELRLVTLTDGVGMGGELLIFKTNAPKEHLKELELLCRNLKQENPDNEIPIWSEVLTSNGYIFEFVDSHGHVTPFNTSSAWLEEHEIYKNITEHYIVNDNE